VSVAARCVPVASRPGHAAVTTMLMRGKSWLSPARLLGHVEGRGD
jgi:hypothetical protein